MIPIEYANFLRDAAEYGRIFTRYPTRHISIENRLFSAVRAANRITAIAERTYVHICHLCQLEQEQSNKWVALGLQPRIFICNDCDSHGLDCSQCEKTALKVRDVAYTKKWEPTGQIMCRPCYTKKILSGYKAEQKKHTLAKGQNKGLLISKRKRIYGAAEQSVLRYIEKSKQSDEPIVIRQFLAEKAHSDSTPAPSILNISHARVQEKTDTP